MLISICTNQRRLIDLHVCVQVNSERDVTYYSYMLICRVTYTGSNNNKNSMCWRYTR